MMIFPVVQALVLGAWTIAVAAIFFGLDLRWETLPLALPAALLAALSFSALALAVTAALIVFKQAPGLGALLAGITLVSGLYFPAQLLPGWIRWTAEVQPFTPAVDLLRNLLVGLPAAHSDWVYVGASSPSRWCCCRWRPGAWHGRSRSGSGVARSSSTEGGAPGAYGLAISSEARLPGLDGASGATRRARHRVVAATALTDAAGPLLGSSGEGTERIDYHRCEAGILVRGGRYGDHLVDAAGTEVRSAIERADPTLWRGHVLGQALPLAASLQGLEVFHAGAVATGDGVIALAGPSGVGKSTLVGALVTAAPASSPTTCSRSSGWAAGSSPIRDDARRRPGRAAASAGPRLPAAGTGGRDGGRGAPPLPDRAPAGEHLRRRLAGPRALAAPARGRRRPRPGGPRTALPRRRRSGAGRGGDPGPLPMSDLDAPLGPAAKLRLAGEILVVYAGLRLRLRRRSLPRTLDSLRAPRRRRVGISGPARAPGPGDVGTAGADRAARAVTTVLRPLPIDSRCLVTSLVLIAVLARRGAPAALVIGVVPGPTFAAHAWVEFGGVPLLKPGEARDGRLVELR